VANKKLEHLYKTIFEYLEPDIQGRSQGVLYTVLAEILYGTEHFKLICDNFNITDSATWKEDQEIVNGLISNPGNNVLTQINVFRNKEAMELYWIVVIACTLAGASYCIKYYLTHIKQQNIKQAQGGNAKNSQPEASSSQTISPPKKPLTAALCLVVPASVVSNLRKDNPVNASEIEQIIDNASYFLCTTIEDANSKQQSIQTTDEVISLDSNREVYIRIHIADGQAMIDKKATYFLKRNLPSHGQGVVKQLACLRNLSGLETFNRI
jgi:hypothetical protein